MLEPLLKFLHLCVCVFFPVTAKYILLHSSLIISLACSVDRFIRLLGLLTHQISKCFLYCGISGFPRTCIMYDKVMKNCVTSTVVPYIVFALLIKYTHLNVIRLMVKKRIVEGIYIYIYIIGIGSFYAFTFL